MPQFSFFIQNVHFFSRRLCKKKLTQQQLFFISTTFKQTNTTPHPSPPRIRSFLLLLLLAYLSYTRKIMQYKCISSLEFSRILLQYSRRILYYLHFPYSVIYSVILIQCCSIVVLLYCSVVCVVCHSLECRVTVASSGNFI